ncbi:MAG: DUF721 domain-containing protein [Synechococcaceae cyanobacterium]|nr:DUF721 domain-containing protein [Synechococcaceae cyanobacterium]
MASVDPSRPFTPDAAGAAGSPLSARSRQAEVDSGRSERDRENGPPADAPPDAGAAAGPGRGRPRRRLSTGRRRGSGPSLRMRRFGNLSLLLPSAAPPAQSLEGCLAALRRDWQQQGSEAALWLAWPDLAGPQLAPHCRPLQFRHGLLTVGALPGPWLQALQYNRHQLMGSLRAAGFAVRDLRVQQHHPQAMPPAASADAQDSWDRHPSRSDVHGMADCPDCARPAPVGEMARWGHCSFCRRARLAVEAPPPYPEAPEEEPESGRNDPGPPLED